MGGAHTWRSDCISRYYGNNDVQTIFLNLFLNFQPFSSLNHDY